MGQDLSTSYLPSQGTILNKSSDTVILMNRILDFILRNADIADMISLNETEGCKKWIIIAESQLSNLFDKIQIQPELGKDGILYLKKTKDLEREAKTGKVADYCKILAFFFIRLFQVVGALSLSVLDSQLPDRDYLEGEKKEIIEKRGIPFFPKEIPKKKRFGLFGGELSGVESFSDSLKIFNKYLIKEGSIYKIENHFARPPTRVVGWSAEINNNSIKFTNTDIDNSQSITFTIDIATDRLVTKETLRNGTQILFTSSFKYEYSSIDGKLYIVNRGIQSDFIKGLQDIFREIRIAPKSNTIVILKGLNFLERYSNSIQKISNTNIYIKSNELEASDPTFEFEMKSKENEKKTINISFTINMTKINDIEYTLKIDNIKSLTKDVDFDTDLDEKEVTFKREKSITTKPELLYKQQTIPRYLENQMEKLYKKAEESIKYGYSQTKEGYAKPLSDPETRQIWQSLIQKPPIKAFCSARALQLLNLSGLSQAVPKEIHPLIYSTQFPLVKNRSLPLPGAPITESLSIKSLAKLYNTPDFVKVSDSRKDISLQNLIQAFDPTNTSKLLNEIKEESGKPFGTITNSTQISFLRGQAVKLFNKQFEHTKKVSNLINKIFIIKNNIELNPTILAKGVKGIEEVAIEARDLLTDYYSTCQIEYKKGVEALKMPLGVAP